MREIKFRTWFSDFNYMAYDNFYNKDKSIDLNSFVNSFNRNHKLMQYTGIRDINGICIYECDIIRTKYGEFIMDWNTELCRFGLRILQKRIKWAMNISALDEYEIIGNIYENKELLDG